MLYFKKNNSWLNFGFNFIVLAFFAMVSIHLGLRFFVEILGIDISPRFRGAYFSPSGKLPVSYRGTFEFVKNTLFLLANCWIFLFLYNRKKKLDLFYQEIEEYKKQHNKTESDVETGTAQ